MKNCSSASLKLPSPITRAASAAAAISVARLNAVFASGAYGRSPSTAAHAAAASGIASTTISSTLLLLLQRLEVMQIEAVELLADLKEKHSEHEHRDEDVERDPELDDHRHAVSRAHRAEEQPVLHGQEPDDLRHRLAARDHRE